MVRLVDNNEWPGEGGKETNYNPLHFQVDLFDLLECTNLMKMTSRCFDPKFISPYFFSAFLDRSYLTTQAGGNI